MIVSMHSDIAAISAPRIAALERKLREVVASLCTYWEQAPGRQQVSVAVQDAFSRVETKLDSDPGQLLAAADRLVRVALPAIERHRSWVTKPLAALIPGLDSITRQLHYSLSAHTVLQLGEDVMSMADPLGTNVLTLSKTDALRVAAAAHVIQDSVYAVESYRLHPPFRYVDEAYLAKYGLLQALQLGFAATEASAEAFGLRARADRQPGGKTVKVIRNVVAGHPLGGSLQGKAWQHFHDRQTAHDKSVLRIMSFASSGSGDWTGQTQQTQVLIDDGFAVMDGILTLVCTHLTTKLGGATGH
jgi:hypothetical protein